MIERLFSLEDNSTKSAEIKLIFHIFSKTQSLIYKFKLCLE